MDTDLPPLVHRQPDASDWLLKLHANVSYPVNIKLIRRGKKKRARAARLLSNRLAGFAAAGFFALLRLWDPPALEIARNYVFDLYERSNARSVTEFPAAVIDIDDKSLAAIGQWPWPRTVLASLVQRLTENGAAAIGFDIVFAEPDRLSPQNIARLLHRADAGLAQSVAVLPDSDKEFAAAIGQSRVVLGGSALWSGTDSRVREAIERAPKVPVATIGGDPRAELLHVPFPLRNLPILDAAAAGRAMLTVLPERDGIIRRAPMILWAGNNIEPGFAVELIRVASGASSLLVKRDTAGVKSVAVAGVKIPTGADGQLWIPFSAHDSRRYVSAAAVLAGEVPRERIEGKIAIVGTSAAGLFDLKSTPAERVMPGVEIHAQIIESILSGTTLVRPNYATGLEVTLAALTTIILVITAPLASAAGVLFMGSVIALCLTAAALYLYEAQNLLIDISYPLGSSFAVFLLMTFLNYRREERRRNQVRAAFTQYLSPDLVEQLIREPERLVLGGETREMSILFSDVRGFTAIAESFKSNPAGLTALMNRMLTKLSRPIIEQRGTIDKYIGDAIMAFWNAPLDDPNHALNASKAALGILKHLDELNAERREEARQAGTVSKDLQIGIGISSGTGVVGNMGSDIRFDYSVLGDSVNLASRLESLTAYYGVRILIASETARRCNGKMAVLEIDRVRVKGKQDAETVFCILGGLNPAGSNKFKPLESAFHAMLSAYRSRNWEQALIHLAKCRENEFAQEVSRLLEIYASRIQTFIKDPPAEDWDGVFNAHSSIT